MDMNDGLQEDVGMLQEAVEIANASALIEDYFFVNEAEIDVPAFEEVPLIP